MTFPGRATLGLAIPPRVAQNRRFPSPEPHLTRYLVTSALPYANGPIHFGHVAGAYLPADLYVRTLRMMGEEVLSICGTDEHGVAITLKADQEGTPYGEYVQRWHGEIQTFFDSLGIQHDIFSGTSQCPQHTQAAQDFFRKLSENGYLEKRETTQLYCENDSMFLADRYVGGTCYSCGFEKAPGRRMPSLRHLDRPAQAHRAALQTVWLHPGPQEHPALVFGPA